MEYGSVNDDQRRSNSPNRSGRLDSTETRVKMGYGRNLNTGIDPTRHRFPHAIVWTPIPCISWLFPFIGHMGIALSSGVIRDFAGSYFVSEDDMAFGWPSMYWQLSLDKVVGGAVTWDKGVSEASDEYNNNHMHNLFCDNCHSHVALALNTMNYGGSRNWNMVKLACMMLVKGKYVGVAGFLKQWLPFLIMATLFIVVIVTFPIMSRH